MLENWTATYKRMKLQYFLTPYTKINSKWFKDLYVRPDTIKLPEENTGRTLFDINLSNIFWIGLLKQTETKINKWAIIKLKSFCTTKETSTKQKYNLLNGRRYLQMIWLVRDYYPTAHGNIKKQTTQLKKWEELSIHFSKEDRGPTDTWRDAQYH